MYLAEIGKGGFVLQGVFYALRSLSKLGIDDWMVHIYHDPTDDCYEADLFLGRCCVEPVAFDGVFAVKYLQIPNFVSLLLSFVKVRWKPIVEKWKHLGSIP